MSIFLCSKVLGAAYCFAAPLIPFEHQQTSQSMKDFLNAYDGCAFE